MEFEIPEEKYMFQDTAVRQRQPSRRNSEMPDPPQMEEHPADQITEPFMSMRHSAPTEGFDS